MVLSYRLHPLPPFSSRRKQNIEGNFPAVAEEEVFRGRLRRTNMIKLSCWWVAQPRAACAYVGDPAWAPRFGSVQASYAQVIPRHGGLPFGGGAAGATLRTVLRHEDEAGPSAGKCEKNVSGNQVQFQPDWTEQHCSNAVVRCDAGLRSLQLLRGYFYAMYNYVSNV